MKAYFINIEKFSKDQLNEVYDEIRRQQSTDRVTKPTQAGWWGNHGEYFVNYQVTEYGEVSMVIELVE